MVKGNKTVNKEQNKNKKKDIKKEEQEVIVDTVETVTQNNDELSDRINKLYGLSTEPVRGTKDYDPKELEEVRKKLILLLTGVIIFGFIAIVILINPFDFGKNNSNSDNDNRKEEEKIDEEKIDEEKISLGEIDLSNTTVTELNSLVTFTASDFMTIDLFPLYSSDLIESASFPNDIKLYLLKRSTSFSEMLSNINIKDYMKTCDTNGIILSIEEFDKAVSETFGPNVKVEYSDINYVYYDNNLGEKKITLSYANDNYLIKCNDFATGGNITKFVQQRINKAVKIEDAIEIYQNVVFINQTGVYKDTNFSQLITNETTAELEDYIANGTIYKYTFTEEGDNYYLSRIEKVKETN